MKKDAILFGSIIIIVAVLLFAVSIPAALDGYHYEIVSYDVQNLGKNPTNPPVIVIIDNCALWKFTVDTDKVHSTFPVPGDYWGLDIDFYVVWTNDGGVDDNTKNVTWQINYQTAKDGDQVSGSHANSPKSVTDSYNSTSGWIEHTTGKMTVGYADFQTKKCLIVRIMAITPPGDALTCEPHMLGVCIGYWAVNVDDTDSG